MSLKTRVLIIGGGLAGLIAANRAVDDGAAVTILEGGKSPGGRALTQLKDDFYFNLGPHALYAAAGHQNLTEMCVAH